MEDKCHAVLTQTNFFDVNCALSCKMCALDPNYGNLFSLVLTKYNSSTSRHSSSTHIGASSVLLRKMAFTGIVSIFEKNNTFQAAKGLRFPTDHYAKEYEEILDISPANVPMFGPPSLNLT